MCMWFGYNPCILVFVTFSTLQTLSFSDLRFYESLETLGTLWAQLLIQFYTDFYETLHMFLPWSGDVHVFGYNPWINFYHFFHFVNFVIFWPQILWKCIDSGYLVSAIPYTISCLYATLHIFFFHGLKMCMWFGFNPAVNFCNFSTLLTLSFFRRCDINFTEVRSILIYISILIFKNNKKLRLSSGIRVLTFQKYSCFEF